LLNEKLGISTDVVKTNTHSDIMSISNPLDEAERAFIQKMIDDTYQTFVNVVAEGRHKSYEEIDAIGGGRVWAGANALELGLIDMFGGLERSVEVAAEMAGLENYRVQSLPKLDDPMTAIMKQLTGSAQLRAGKMLRNELGDQYVHYKKIQEIRNMHGIQMIMPFEFEVN
jgi:protease-4